MKEIDLRKRHRYIGVFLALFIMFQAGSGLLLAVADLIKPHDHSLHAVETSHHGENLPAAHHQDVHSQGSQAESNHHEAAMRENQEEKVPQWVEMLKAVHDGGGIAGSIYRIFLGIGVVSMAFSGLLIFFKIQGKQKEPKRQDDSA
jgi:uncharacterized iron-regulated membrane protein